MIKMTKKTIAAISGGSAVIIAGSTILANVAFKSESGTKRIVNPLGRDKTYHHFSLINKIRTNTKLKDLVDYVKDEKQLIYFINENKFVNTFKSIVQDALKAIPTFSLNYLNYKIECTYKIEKTRSIRVDLVWYEPTSKTKFYDQFVLELHTS